MIADQVRMEAYQEALKRAVTPESVVLDVGTGIGTFAILACRYGARRVFAVEPGDVLQLARRIARDNGVADRIEFIQDLSTRISLPEPADVMISDLRSVLPLFQHHIPSIIDARSRLLKPDAVLIPLRDTLWAAVVHAPDHYRQWTQPWSESLDVDMQATHPILTQMSRRAFASTNELLTEPLPWATLNYETIDSPNVRGSLDWTVTKASTGHGILVWFDTVLADGIGFSNAPGNAETIYGREIFPFSSEVEVDPGDTISVAFSADLVSDRYVWRWDTRVMRGGRNGTVRASFNQTYLSSEFYSSERHR
jgi:protein arginine N-methyltransferase 1